MKITAQNLIDFSSRYQADRIFPELIRRLIRATSDNIEDVLFPSGESTFRPGMDGELQAIGKAPFVPDGASVWELSTEQTPHAKGKRDFDKRSGPDAKDSYMGKPRVEITYVAVSMRRWSGENKAGRQAFIDVAKSGEVWRDVRVIDADHLEDWLDQTPSVAAWLGREMGLVSDDVLSIEHAWSDYSLGCSPPLSAELLLANRKEKAETLTQAGLVPGVTRFKADSPGEAAAFVEAAIFSLPAEDARRNALLAKGVVISEPTSARFLTDTENTLFVVATGRAAEIANLLAERGHTVVVPYGNSHLSSRGSALVELPRARRHEFTEALIGMGMAEDVARSAAAACHCSITVLRRAFDQAQSRLPGWATPKELRKLVGPLCCGAWDHDSAADTAIVAQIDGTSSYTEIEHAIQDALMVDDAPLLRAGKLTTLSAPADIWQLGIDLKIVNKPLLDRFRIAVLEVLGELDPALELPPDKRAYAQIYDKRRRYSGWLRHGLAEILRLIAVNDGKLSYISGFSAQHFVNEILEAMPGLATDHRMLASLDSMLPVLAEAAPDPFLAALETLTAGDGSKLSSIFEGSDDPMYGRTYYLGTLRALEMLAWDPARLMRTTQILARMAQLDPGGRLTNRPANSLVEIFLPWNPHTNAQSPHRHRALAKLCERFPDIGWILLSKLLPDANRISHGTAQPEWREMSASNRPVPTYGSRDSDHDAVFRLARPLAELRAARWLELIKAAGESRNTPRLEELLDEVDARHSEFNLAGQDKVLWEGLRGLIAKHRSFATANWAMPLDMLDRLQKTADTLQPTDLIALNRHLFNNTLIERGYQEETFEERSERSKRERDSAVAEIAKDGIEEILRLAREVKTVGLLAPSLVNATSPKFCQEVVMATYGGDDALAWLASLLTAYGASTFGLDWGKNTIGLAQADGARPAQIAQLLKVWDDTRALFDYIASMEPEIQEEYWRRRDVYVRTSDAQVLDTGIAKLSEYDRNIELIEFLGGRLNNTGTDLLVQVLSSALRQALVNTGDIARLDGYWLGEIFKALRERPDVDQTALIGLEYNWLPAFHSYGDEQELALHVHLGASAEFFVEVLSDLYKADWEIRGTSDNDSSGVSGDVAHSGIETTEDDDAADLQKRAKADIAYKVLNSWRRLPWLAEDGSIDYAAMHAWARSALAIAGEKGRHDVAAREIGKLLAYAPADKLDEVWPAREVRELIETLAVGELESGLVVELFNKRGVHARPFEGGGAPERALAQAATEASDALQAEWPRTAMMMRDNAKQWAEHAEMEDRRASERRISL
ncbi:hypothetical protein [Xanthomonas campestris]|uniref:hypothetical protein n=1 Tax=Xanthomonas campestris TaxID=339 RepID=UPI0011C08129|nr:hypothetical protein [Xanthomonas campestris]MEA9574037.1 hypothetical protein [Xanthomonas campestris]MEB2112872.1 hypothetical protein [Xanthomonas campestris pv. campestris]